MLAPNMEEQKNHFLTEEGIAHLKVFPSIGKRR